MLSICQLFENNQKSNFDYLVDLKNYPFILDYSEVKMFSSQWPRAKARGLNRQLNRVYSRVPLPALDTH